MKIKEFIRAILRGATFITTFIISFGMIYYLHKLVGIEETLWNTIFWVIVCFLTALKISLIKEDF